MCAAACPRCAPQLRPGTLAPPHSALSLAPLDRPIHLLTWVTWLCRYGGRLACEAAVARARLRGACRSCAERRSATTLKCRADRLLPAALQRGLLRRHGLRPGRGCARGAQGAAVAWLPLGYGHLLLPGAAGLRTPASARRLLWSWAGSVGRKPQREAFLGALRAHAAWPASTRAASWRRTTGLAPTRAVWRPRPRCTPACCTTAPLCPARPAAPPSSSASGRRWCACRRPHTARLFAPRAATVVDC